MDCVQPLGFRFYRPNWFSFRINIDHEVSQNLIRGAHREINFSNEGRAGVPKGVDVLANAVSISLVPKGKLNNDCVRDL